MDLQFTIVVDCIAFFSPCQSPLLLWTCCLFCPFSMLLEGNKWVGRKIRTVCSFRKKKFFGIFHFYDAGAHTHIVMVQQYLFKMRKAHRKRGPKQNCYSLHVVVVAFCAFVRHCRFGWIDQKRRGQENVSGSGSWRGREKQKDKRRER